MPNENDLKTNSEQPKTIQNVLDELDVILQENIEKEDTLGYFSALYRRVTYRIQQEVELNNFEDNERMVQLDVVFAQRYLDAYTAYRTHQPLTKSWQVAFDLSEKYWFTVIQHLLLGMNAHINLDLGIAAAEVSGKTGMKDLKTDFYKINEILSSLVDDVQQNLVSIWPPLKYILQKTGQFDNHITDFSMQLARDGAWEFANELAVTPDEDLAKSIAKRDELIAKKASLITQPGFIISGLLKVVRLGETGSVSDKIKKLSKMKSDEMNVFGIKTS